MKRNEQQPFPKAACRDHPHLDPEDWFPNGDTLTDSNRQAINTCHTCHHETDCAILGRLGKNHGIWGGLFLENGTPVPRRQKKAETRRNLRRVA